MLLSSLLQSAQGEMRCAEGAWDREIEGLSADSREEMKNSLFFCLTDGQTDSHAFAAQAVKNGAVAIVCERALALSVPQFIVEDSRLALGVLASVFYGEPSKSLKVIGVTGTNGKTTTSCMLESICRESGRRAGVIGTLGIRYDGREESSGLTTPDPICLQATLAKMLARGVEYVIMEVSAHALYYKKTAGVRFCCCIFTNLTQDHLDFFPSMQAYKQAKLSLFTQNRCPIAVVNGDEAEGREIARLRGEWGGKTVFYGLNAPADAFAVLTDEGLQGTACMLNINDRLCRVNLSLLGRHNVYNGLAAATCAVELGLELGGVARGLTKLSKVTGRLERVASLRGATVYVDFAHTPDGLSKSLATLKAYCRGRLFCVFGCGGNRDRGKRPLMGEVAAKQCDFAVLTADNPRCEDPLDIIKQIEGGYRRFSARYVIVPNRRQGIRYALELLQAGDILLIAGKGGEEHQEIMGIKYPFNDQAIVEEFMEEKGEE